MAFKNGVYADITRKIIIEANQTGEFKMPWHRDKSIVGPIMFPVNVASKIGSASSDE